MNSTLGAGVGLGVVLTFCVAEGGTAGVGFVLVAGIGAGVVMDVYRLGKEVGVAHVEYVTAVLRIYTVRNRQDLFCAAGWVAERVRRREREREARRLEV